MFSSTSWTLDILTGHTRYHYWSVQHPPLWNQSHPDPSRVCICLTSVLSISSLCWRISVGEELTWCPIRSVRRRNSSFVLLWLLSFTEKQADQQGFPGWGVGEGGWRSSCVYELMSQNYSLCGTRTYISCRQMQHQPHYPSVPASWELVPGTVKGSRNLAEVLTCSFRVISFNLLNVCLFSAVRQQV